MRRPVRLPEFFKYVALALAGLYVFIWLDGGISFARIGHTETYYWAGWGVALAYIPFYLYRTRVEDKRGEDAASGEVVIPAAVVSSE